MKKLFASLLLLLLVAACTSNQPVDDSQELTVGTVQKEIKLGMTGAEVATVLGSPNIVTTDENRREVWVYDKVATEYVSSSSDAWVFAVFTGAAKSSRSSAKTQKNLTIVIKFDENNQVRDFAYHSSKF